MGEWWLEEQANGDHRLRQTMLDDIGLHARVASWGAGAHGLDWLHALAREGRSLATINDGDPIVLAARASDALPVIVGGDGEPPGLIGSPWIAMHPHTMEWVRTGTTAAPAGTASRTSTS
jgi:hypothetical protein